MGVVWGSLYSNKDLYEDVRTSVHAALGLSSSKYLRRYFNHEIMIGDLHKRINAGRVFGAQWVCPELNSSNWLTEQYRANTMLLFLERVPTTLDSVGYDGWELFFNMVPSWKGELKDLPEVVSSIIANR